MVSLIIIILLLVLFGHPPQSKVKSFIGETPEVRSEKRKPRMLLRHRTSENIIDHHGTSKNIIEHHRTS